MRRNILSFLLLAMVVNLVTYHLSGIPAAAATPDSILANKKPSPLSETNFDRPGTDFKL